MDSWSSRMGPQNLKPLVRRGLVEHEGVMVDLVVAVGWWPLTQS